MKFFFPTSFLLFSLFLFPAIIVKADETAIYGTGMQVPDSGLTIGCGTYLDKNDFYRKKCCLTEENCDTLKNQGMTIVQPFVKGGKCIDLENSQKDCVPPPPASVSAPTEDDTIKVTLRPQVSIPFSDKFYKGNEISITGSTIAEYVLAIYNFFIFVGGFLTVIFFMIGGAQWLLSRGSPSEVYAAKKTMGNAAIGLVLILTANVFLRSLSSSLIGFKPLIIEDVKAEFIETTFSEADLAPANLISSGQPGVGSVPIFKQTNFPNTLYGNCGSINQSTIRSSGCGPTSAAMVMKSLGASVDPEIVAKSFVDNNFRVCGKGTSTEAFTSPKVLSSYGLKGQIIPLAKIPDKLKSNTPIIVSVGPSVFTSSGHYIVLVNMDNNQIVGLNDPFRDCYKLSADLGSKVKNSIKKSGQICTRYFPWSYLSGIIKNNQGYLISK